MAGPVGRCDGMLQFTGRASRNHGRRGGVSWKRPERRVSVSNCWTAMSTSPSNTSPLGSSTSGARSGYTWHSA